MNKSIPIIPLKWCEFSKDTGVLKIASEYFGMPRELEVVSHHTGKIVRFKPIGPDHPLFCEDHWDGEQQIYEPVGNAGKVKILVIYHAW